MRFTLTIDTDNALVRATHIGPMSLNDVMASRRQAGRALHEHGWIRMLVDLRQATSGPDTGEIFEIGASQHVDLPPDVCLALVVPAHLAADARFCESVSANRGVNMQVFDSEATALIWLLEHPAP